MSQFESIEEAEREWASLHNQLVVAEAGFTLARAQLTSATDALRQADRIASEAHDAIWTEGLPVFTAIHGENPDSASNCIHRLHAAIRPVLERLDGVPDAIHLAAALDLYANPEHWTDEGDGLYNEWLWDGGCDPPWKTAADALAAVPGTERNPT